LLIFPNISNVCLNCLNEQINFNDKFNNQIIIKQCRNCERWLVNNKWYQAIWESSQLLTICLNKIKILKKNKIINAQFIWIEPHSRQFKISCIIQKEIFFKTQIEKSIIYTFNLKKQQCEDCCNNFTKHFWKVLIQIRRKIKQKRTLFYLEQAK
jgi:nonsense-mediated mRNA decay protein 3